MAKASSLDSGIIGDGADVRAEHVVSLKGTICDKSGCKLNTAMLEEVTFLPKVKFNLFSLSKMTKKHGWQ